jgi:hypothetical protein
LKLQYYIDNKWENKYIEAAQNEFNLLYKTKYILTENTISNVHFEDSLLQHIYKKRNITNDNELEQYLATPVVSYGTNILQWWQV